MGRAEFRRQNKQYKQVNPNKQNKPYNQRKSHIPAPVNMKNFTDEQMADMTGCKVESIKAYLATREIEMREALIEESQQKLIKAEDYLAVANVLISLVAIRETWGFTKANKRFIENFNPALEYLNKHGVDKVYKELQEQMGISLEFESMDINKEFGFGGTQE